MKPFPWIKTYIRKKPSGKTVDTNAHKNIVLNKFCIIGHNFLLSPQEDGPKLRV